MHLESTLSSHFQVPMLHAVVLGGYDGTSCDELESSQPDARSIVVVSEIQYNLQFFMK